MDENNEYNAEIISIDDDEGNVHNFEVVDKIETDDARYIALIPIYDDPEEILNGETELIVLEVIEEDGEEFLAPIEDDDTLDEIGSIFEERLQDLYEIEPFDIEQ